MTRDTICCVRAAIAAGSSAFAPAGASAAQEEQDEGWDVEATLAPTSSLDFETNEATWTNVDVSSDGTQLVFDLLGDLFVMPVDGTGDGLATRITEGAAFDMQPRFSPDGSLIAFASDRDGTTNLWILQSVGTHPRQVSTEKK